MGTLVRRDGKHRQKHHLRSAYPVLDVCGNAGLSVLPYRLFTDLGTVLRRKITLRHSMTLVSSKDLFKPVLGSVWH